MAYKLCPYRRDVQQHKYELQQYIQNGVNKAQKQEIRIPPHVLSQTIKEIGLEDTTIKHFGDLEDTYQNIIRRGTEKWTMLEHQLKTRYAKAKEELENPSLNIVDDDLFCTQLFAFDTEEMEEMLVKELKEIQSSIAKLKEEYTKEVQETSETWKPYKLLLKELDRYHDFRKKELYKFQHHHLNALDQEKSPGLYPLPRQLLVHYNQISQYIPIFPNDTVLQFKQRVISQFHPPEHISHYILIIVAGPSLKEHLMLKDYHLGKMKSIKLVHLA